jgi:hypothetical protein
MPVQKDVKIVKRFPAAAKPPITAARNPKYGPIITP